MFGKYHRYFRLAQHKTEWNPAYPSVTCETLETWNDQFRCTHLTHPTTISAISHINTHSRHNIHTLQFTSCCFFLAVSGLGFGEGDRMSPNAGAVNTLTTSNVFYSFRPNAMILCYVVYGKASNNPACWTKLCSKCKKPNMDTVVYLIISFVQ